MNIPLRHSRSVSQVYQGVTSCLLERPQLPTDVDIVKNGTVYANTTAVKSQAGCVYVEVRFSKCTFIIMSPFPNSPA